MDIFSWFQDSSLADKFGFVVLLIGVLFGVIGFMTSSSFDDGQFWVKFVGVSVMMYVTFGHWHHGLESLGIPSSVSLVVAIVADILLIALLLANELAWTEVTRPKEGWGGVLVVMGLRFVQLYLYAWICQHGGGVSFEDYYPYF